MAADGVGLRLREARRRSGISLRGLAQQVGVSPSLISQVETGKTQPSVSTLFAIVTHLCVSLDEILGITGAAPTSAHTNIGPTSAVVQRGAENPVLEMENGVRWERLAAAPSGLVDSLFVTYAPGAASSIRGELMEHSGYEFAYLTEGELTLQLEFESYVLHAGDSLQFDSGRPHLFSNRSSEVARGVWFVVHQPGQATPGPRAHNTSAAKPPPAISSAADVLRVLGAAVD